MTSFVRPDVIPQLADAEQVLAAVQRRDGVAFSILIPNERGLERALAQRERFDEINVFVSASETHNRRNVNRSGGVAGPSSRPWAARWMRRSPCLQRRQEALTRMMGFSSG